jgi:hypothetical protein
VWCGHNPLPLRSLFSIHYLNTSAILSFNLHLDLNFEVIPDPKREFFTIAPNMENKSEEVT